MLKKPILGIVVPCFNEDEVITESSSRLVAILKKMISSGLVDESSKIYFIDDGSTDKTWGAIEELSNLHASVCGVKLSRNFGHQNALLCGLMSVPGDILISVDADLQDDINVIPKMVELYLGGSEIVYGVRSTRTKDAFFKRFSAELYYKLMTALNVDILYNHADFRLLSRKVIANLSDYREVNLFLRGLIRLLGYSSSVVEYERAERLAGQSKYDLKRMFSLAWVGVTSFSTAPLRLITSIGFIVSFVSIGLAIWGLYGYFFMDSVPGWASTVIPLYMLGGIQLLCIGIAGEYMAKIYLETKGRPKFHIDKTIGIEL